LRGLAVAAVFALGGASSAHAAWWEAGGAWHDVLDGAGYLSAP
jgi:hypothetical protein